MYQVKIKKKTIRTVFNPSPDGIAKAINISPGGMQDDEIIRDNRGKIISTCIEIEETIDEILCNLLCEKTESQKLLKTVFSFSRIIHILFKTKSPE